PPRKEAGSRAGRQWAVDAKREETANSMQWLALSSAQPPDFSAPRPTNLYVISLDYPLPITGALNPRDVDREKYLPMSD
ncbi:MAG TPA: hypothetical protein VKO18_22280, partial [Terriglobia bacterium]|nr:hypothetical protein [Terriglobia bacterium]